MSTASGENWNHSRGIGEPYEKESRQRVQKTREGVLQHAQQKKEMGLQE